MVVEALVSSLLDKYLGGYIDNLDTKRLKVDLWNGNVNLENLYLKPSALADLNLPVTISVGYLHKLSLQVPWSNLYGQPTKVSVEGLYLLVVPKIEVKFDAQREEKENHETKMREVLKIEQLRKKKEEIGENSTNDTTLIERLQLQVLRNLELTIENIHIVYEDRTTNSSRPFSFGVTLNFFTLHTTNDQWKPTVLKEDTPLINKLGELSALSIYWNNNIKPRSGNDRKEIIASLRSEIATNNKNVPANISYILRPLSVLAKMKLVMKPQNDSFQRPMFDIKVDLDEISLNINRDQYSDLLDLFEFLDYLTIKTKYIKYKGENSDENISKRQKWKFCYDCVLNEHVRPQRDCYKWTNIKSHLNRSREYRSLHVLSLTTNLNDEQKQRVQQLEKSLDVLNLIYLRQSAEIEAKKKKEKEPKTWWGTVSNWWGGVQPENSEEIDLKKVFTEKEKEKLFEAIGYDSNEVAATFYPEKYIDVVLEVQLSTLDTTVWSKFDSNNEQRVVLRTIVPGTSLSFSRRPAAEAYLFSLGLNSFEVFGISTDFTQKETENHCRPVLVEPLAKDSTKKLLQIEFETNPIDKSSDYRIKVLAESLEIKYNAPTINKLISCFEQDKQRKLEGIKRAAYSKYTDVKSRSLILMSHNLEKIKVLDIDIDVQSAFFLLPANGIYSQNSAVVCMDFGHLTVKRNKTDETSNFDTKNKNIDEIRKKSYTKFKLKLENVQLLHSHNRSEENWQKARLERNTRLHLINPIELDLDLDKCIYSDDAVLPAWKVAGQIPDINVRLSNTRIFQLVHHLSTIPLPESKPAIEQISTNIQNPSIASTLATVESMKSEKTNQEENLQLTQIEASFTLKKIEIIIEETNNQTKKDESFLRILLYTLSAQTTKKTFDWDLQVSLSDFIVFHDQFIGQNDQPLRLISAEFDEGETEQQRILVSFNLHHASRENPFFQSAHQGIEYDGSFNFQKLIVILKLEALLSILRFQNSLLESLSDKSPTIEKPVEQTEKIEEISTKQTTTNSSTVSIKIEANLDEFQIILETNEARVFDIQVGGIKAKIDQGRFRTDVHLILSHLKIFDPYKNALYKEIISQQSDENELLRIDLTLFDYKKSYQKTLEDLDCDVQVRFAKANIIFLYKHIGAFLGFLDSLNITTAALNMASSQAEAALQQVQKLQEQSFKVRLDVVFDAPIIIIPTNSSSNETLSIDLGQLTLKTSFIDDPKRFLVEKQTIRMENILATRTKLSRTTNFLGEVVLLECAEFNVLVERLLFPNKVPDEAGLLMDVLWESVHFHLAKDDFACVMKILTENFSENLRDQILDDPLDQKFHYTQENREKEDEKLRNAVIEKQKKSQIDDKIRTTMKMKIEIKELVMTLYLGNSNLKARREPRDDQMKLAQVKLNPFQARFRQSSDSGFFVSMRIKNFLIDDLRSSNKPECLTRMMDRYFTVNSDEFMLITSLEFKPKSATQNTPSQNINAILNSLYICISLDFLLKLQDFFISGLPAAKPPAEPTINNKIVEKPNPAANEPNEMQIQFSVKNPQVILLEDQQNPNSNCLVLDLAARFQMVQVGSESKIYGALTDLTIYSSNFADLTDRNNKESKIKYRILEPAKIDLMMKSNDVEQKLSVNVSNISVSIAPAAVRTLLAVSSSLSSVQTEVQHEKTSISSKSLFVPTSTSPGTFWFIRKNQTDSQSQAEKQSNTGKMAPPKPALRQQLIFDLDTIELKLEVGLGSVTKAVFAMCLSDLTAEIKDWSSNMYLSSTLSIEAALYNENVLCWEPLIEPISDGQAQKWTPWNLVVTMTPPIPSTNSDDEQKDEEIEYSSLLTIRADQLLNLTITKTGLQLAQRLSTLFGDFYNKRLPPVTEEDDQALLSLHNATGYKVTIDHLQGIKFLHGENLNEIILEHDRNVSLDLVRDAHRNDRLSVIENQDRKKRQEFRVKLAEYEKIVTTDRTSPSSYILRPTEVERWPMMLTCFTQVEKDRRIIVLSSAVRIQNRSNVPLLVLNPNSVDKGSFEAISKIDVNQIGYVPIDALYSKSSSSLFLSAAETGSTAIDFFSFNCIDDYNADKKLKLTNGKTIHLTVFKEVVESYQENTKEFNQITFLLHVHTTIQLTNLLPVDIEYFVENKESNEKLQSIRLTTSQTDLIPHGNKKSSLKFTIPSYNNESWISDVVSLADPGHGDYNEHLVVFRCSSSKNVRQIFHLILRIETFHDSLRLLLYSSFWMMNRTNLSLEFKIDNVQTSIPVSEIPFLVSSTNFGPNDQKKGQIRVGDKNEWSEPIPMGVIRSTDMTSSKAENGLIYFICVSITTSSFGFTRLVTFSPSFAVINRSTILLEILEVGSGNQNKTEWKTLEINEVVPLWCRSIKDNSLRVRFQHNQVTSSPFKIDQPHRTLLRMDDEERSAIFVEVVETDAKALRIIFEDYKVGHVPLLIMNRFSQEIRLTQLDHPTSQVLPSMFHNYYSWADPTKPRKLVVSLGSKSFTIEPVVGENPEKCELKYLIFNDGPQMVLVLNPEDPLFNIKAETNTTTSTNNKGQMIQLRLSEIGISLVNDAEHEELLYISLKKSDVIWTEATRSRIKPIDNELAKELEHLYQSHMEMLELHPEEHSVHDKQYDLPEYPVVKFNINGAILKHKRDKTRNVTRQSIEGLWANYFMSSSKTTIHLRVNRIQIDNQLENTIFPVLLHPITPKTSSNEFAHKPFIELSMIQTTNETSKLVNYEYLTLLIQEFAVKVEQGLIVSILRFIPTNDNDASRAFNLTSDLEQTKKTLLSLIESQITSPSDEQKMMFGQLHLSPLKMQISFSMHGNRPSEELLSGFPFASFVLRTLNIAEVQDVVLRMGYFERLNQQLTYTQIYKEAYSHYSSQFLKQIHVFLLGLDVLGNPFGVIRGIAGGVESLFYEPYKGIVEGPTEFAVGVGTGMKNLLGSAVGGAAGAASKITGAIGKGLVQLTFDDEFKASRTRHKDPGATGATEIAVSGKNVVMGFVDGITGVVKKPISGAKKSGIGGFLKGLGQGAVGLIARPTVGIVDFASTSMNVVKRTAQDEDVVRRVRYPRHIGLDRLIRPYAAHEALGFFILSRLNDGEFQQSDVYFAHVTCSSNPPSYLIATTKRLVFVTEISLLGLYDVDWILLYEEISEPPSLTDDLSSIKILTKNKTSSSFLSKARSKPYEDIDYEPKKTGALRTERTFGKLVKCRNKAEAKFMTQKLAEALRFAKK